ncbi:endo--beta-xylanase precursor [Moniliophthora roreri]|nr:endo--beta-xylanase precursor [Moniliophthora roreri]
MRKDRYSKSLGASVVKTYATKPGNRVPHQWTGLCYGHASLTSDIVFIGSREHDIARPLRNVEFPILFYSSKPRDKTMESTGLERYVDYYQIFDASMETYQQNDLFVPEAMLGEHLEHDWHPQSHPQIRTERIASHRPPWQHLQEPSAGRQKRCR